MVAPDALLLLSFCFLHRYHSSVLPFHPIFCSSFCSCFRIFVNRNKGPPSKRVKIYFLRCPPSKIGEYMAYSVAVIHNCFIRKPT